MTAVKLQTSRATSMLILSSKAGSMSPAVVAKIRKAFESSLIVEFDPKMDLDKLITSLNRMLVGWARYHRYGVSKAIFSAVDSHTWGRLMRWIRAKYQGKHRLGMTELRRRFCDKGWRFAHNGVVFTGATSVAVSRYRYRGSTIATPWTPTPAAAKTSG